MKGIVACYMFSVSYLALVSCETQQKQKTRDFESIRPQATYRMQNSKLNDNKKPIIEIDSSFLRQIHVSLDEVNDSIFLPFLGRFQPQENIQYCISEGRHQQLYARITFSDSITAKNALFNWFDRFDQKESLLLYQTNPLKKRKFLLYLCEKRIFFLEASSNAQLESWNTYFVNSLKDESILWSILNDGKTISWFDSKGNKLVKK